MTLCFLILVMFKLLKAKKIKHHVYIDPSNMKFSVKQNSELAMPYFLLFNYCKVQACNVLHCMTLDSLSVTFYFPLSAAFTALFSTRG
jgi:hypothetical protein